MGNVTRLPPPAAPIGRNGQPLSMTANAIRKRAAAARDRAAVEAAAAVHEAATRRRKGDRSSGPVAAADGPAAAVDPPAAAVAAPISGSEATEHVTDTAHVTELGLLTMVSLVGVVGGYAVMLGVTLVQYPGITGWLRAALPGSADMIAGVVAIWCVTGKARLHWVIRWPLAAACCWFIVLAVQTELTAASAAPAAQARARAAAANAAPVEKCTLSLPAVPEHESKETRLAREANEASARKEYADCQADARERHKAVVTNAQAVVPGEDRLPRMLTWLSVIGSAFPSLLVAFIRAARKACRA
jgi:hypothetical protein